LASVARNRAAALRSGRETVHTVPLAMSAPSIDLFAVMNFCFVREEDGRLTQRTSSVGNFVEVERAFAVAREEAERDLARRCVQAQNHGSVIELIDTEWGYDVRQDRLVVSRYWVHDRSPMVLSL
jgi:hypothetical protein